jgi:hypothetical protein
VSGFPHNYPGGTGMSFPLVLDRATIGVFLPSPRFRGERHRHPVTDGSRPEATSHPDAPRAPHYPPPPIAREGVEITDADPRVAHQIARAASAFE